MKKTVLFLAAITFGVLLNAQDNSGFHFTYNHHALSVKDLERSVVFYKNVLQLSEINNRTQMDGIRWFSLGEGKELHLVSVIKEPVTLNKAVHFALNTRDIEAFAKRLSAMHIAYSDWPGKPNTITIRADGVKQLYLQDPDGYWIEINDAGANESDKQIQDEVWQMEELYWQYVQAQDLKGYLTLWDDRFLGYPANNIVSGKEHITDWIVNMFKEHKGSYRYELERKAVNVFGDIVVTLYDETHIWINEKNEVKKEPTNKITHTWKKTENGWVIIGGMGAHK